MKKKIEYKIIERSEINIQKVDVKKSFKSLFEIIRIEKNKDNIRLKMNQLK